MPSISERRDSEEALLGGNNGGRDRGQEGEHRAVNPVEMTPWECLKSVDFWMLFFVNGVASGAGLTLLNNLGQQVGNPGLFQDPRHHAVTLLCDLFRDMGQ